jgi:hypothetical protein
MIHLMPEYSLHQMTITTIYIQINDVVGETISSWKSKHIYQFKKVLLIKYELRFVFRDTNFNSIFYWKYSFYVKDGFNRISLHD